MSLAQILRTQFVGKKVNDVIDEIQSICQAHRYTVEILDPNVNTFNIDVNQSRMCIYQDASGTIKFFRIG